MLEWRRRYIIKIYYKDLLLEVCDRDKCIIDFDKIEKYIMLTKINFICNCGIEYIKTFRQLYKSVGGFCKKCTENTRQEKKKQTCLEKYGVENPLQYQKAKDKCKQTCFNNYGVENPSQSQEVRDKFKQTCLNNLGVEYPMQFSDVAEKQLQNSYKLKEFNFPCGKTILVQGYEPFLLKNLVEEGYTHEDIITKRADVPEIWYEKDNKKHRYYCDAYIPKINTIYEVKSTWTYKKDIEDIPLKKQGCIDAGYLYVLCVYNNKSILQEQNIKIDNT
jgi:hypothetical protein